MNDSTLRTLTDWRVAYANGLAPADLLSRRLERLRRESPAEVWIALATPADLQPQLTALAERAARFGNDAEALRHEMPLYGVPFAAKDNIDVAGFATTAACPAYAYRPDADAQVVSRLLRAGAICLGKTNLDQFATGLVGARSPYGRPSSVFDAERVSGGSSSGSAVAVARGDVAFSLGTDTAGSGRVPAGFNGIVGLKPTPGRVGTSGVVPACRSIDCVSVLATTAADAAVVLAVIEGEDKADPYSAWRTGPARLAEQPCIGVPAHPTFSGDAGYGPAWEAAVAQLERRGHRVVALDFGVLDEVAGLLYDGPWVAERYAVVEALLARDPAAVDPVVRQVVEAARGQSATDAFRGFYRLQAARRAAEAVWQQVDLLMVPTAPGHPRHVEVDADPIGVNSQLGRYTNFVNLLGWCALALPAGTAAGGLPFGVTFIAPAAADAALARFGVDWQTNADPADVPDVGSTGSTGWTGPADRGGQIGLTDPAGRGGPIGRGGSGGNTGHVSNRDGRDEPWPASQPTLPLVVVGAHLSGLPLNGQLVERGARLRAATRTAPAYRLYALPGTVPPKPGLVRVADAGAAIDVELWDMPLSELGSFLALIPAPLGLGTIELADGSQAHGFLCEAHALAGADDITTHGGWRAYLARPQGGADPGHHTRQEAARTLSVPHSAST